MMALFLKLRIAYESIKNVVSVVTNIYQSVKGIFSDDNASPLDKVFAFFEAILGGNGKDNNLMQSHLNKDPKLINHELQINKENLELLKNSHNPYLADQMNKNPYGLDKITPLGAAIFSGRDDLVIELINRGANQKSKDLETLACHKCTSSGRTLLHDAASEGNSKIAELLLANGAKVNALDNRNQTPYQIAEIIKNSIMQTLLMQHGATPTYANQYQHNTPLQATQTPFPPHLCKEVNNAGVKEAFNNNRVNPTEKYPISTTDGNKKQSNTQAI